MDAIKQLQQRLAESLNEPGSAIYSAAVRAGWRPETESAWVSGEDLSTLLGVSAKSVAAWRKHEGFPAVDGAGRYQRTSLREVVRWFAAARADSQGKSQNLEEAQLALLQERTLAVRQKRQTEARVLVTIGEATEAWVDECRRIRSELLAMPRALSAELAGKTAIDIEARLDDAIHGALTRLSASVETAPTNEAREEPEAEPTPTLDDETDGGDE